MRGGEANALSQGKAPWQATSEPKSIDHNDLALINRTAILLALLLLLVLPPLSPITTTTTTKRDESLLE